MGIELVDLLVTQLHRLRPSATLAVCQRPACGPRESLDLVAVSLGFRAIGERWRQIDKVQAAALVSRILARDLAYDTAGMEPWVAEALAGECLLVAGEANFFTNGEFSENGWGGHKVAPATFETGVAWVSAGSVGVLWVQDED